MTTNTGPIRVLLADDHPLLRDGVAGLIADQPDMELVGEASTGLQAIDQFRKQRPDITLLDLQMPELGGIDAIKTIREEFPEARIIILTTYKGDAQVLGALRSGAQAYLLKSALRRELLDTIRAVHQGQKRIPPDVASQLAEHAADDPLTFREVEVLRLIAAGKANKLIAVTLR